MKAIVVSVKIYGLHRWLDCPIHAVRYLRDYHRHEFHIKVWKKVTHNDRDIEIIQFKSAIKNYIREEYYDVESDIVFFGDMSCEMIAEELIDMFKLEACEVLEDGENGAFLTEGSKFEIDWEF